LPVIGATRGMTISFQPMMVQPCLSLVVSKPVAGRR
jgi:hypothetical protein